MITESTWHAPSWKRPSHLLSLVKFSKSQYVFYTFQVVSKNRMTSSKTSNIRFSWRGGQTCQSALTQTESAPGALWRSGGSFRRVRLPKQRPLAADQTILVATHLAAAAVFHRSQKRRAVISDTLLAGAPPRLLGNVAAVAKGLSSGFNKVSETS